MKLKYALCALAVFAAYSGLDCVGQADDRRQDKTVVSEFAYAVRPTFGDKYDLHYTLIALNPFPTVFAGRPSLSIVARDVDGSILEISRTSMPGIPPGGRIAYAGHFYVDRQPAKVEYKPEDAGYVSTDLAPIEFKHFSILSVRSRETETELVISGEVGNPYKKETSATCFVLFRNESGKLVSGYRFSASEIPPLGTSPFITRIAFEAIPPESKKAEYQCEMDFNYIDYWVKFLR